MNDLSVAAPVTEKPPGRARRILQGLLLPAVMFAIFFFALPRVADLCAEWAEIRAMTWMEVTTLPIAAAWNIVTYWFVMLRRCRFQLLQGPYIPATDPDWGTYIHCLPKRSTPPSAGRPAGRGGCALAQLRQRLEPAGCHLL
jgi:hypothetical protein